jgi:D-tagatose-1,6-bisphosphate aldolase subunit GatZ/KbaZ
LMERLTRLTEETGVRRTLMAACPNSRTVIRAAIRSARRNNAPIKFAATLNQVDTDGGYTGLTQERFVRLIREEAVRYHFKGPLIVAVDHGGPWLRDDHRTGQWNLERTMEWVKNSFSAAIDAGYDLIHVDPTVDPTVPEGATIPIERVAERTVELIAHCERHRASRKLPPISYEVGTEEVHGGLADLGVFREFFELLKRGLADAGLPDVWPCFVVGKVGTDLHTTLFDADTARTIVKIAAGYGSWIKGHYTDNVDNPRDYPATGMGAANIGPEFTEREYEALTELDEVEKELAGKGRNGPVSGMKEKLWEAVIASGRWKKWLQEGEDREDFASLVPARQEWLVRTGCRYIWADPAVEKARAALYANLAAAGIDAEEVVLSQIENAMDKYYRSFNLVNLNPLL